MAEGGISENRGTSPTTGSGGTAVPAGPPPEDEDVGVWNAFPRPPWPTGEVSARDLEEFLKMGRERSDGMREENPGGLGDWRQETWEGEKKGRQQMGQQWVRPSRMNGELHGGGSEYRRERREDRTHEEPEEQRYVRMRRETDEEKTGRLEREVRQLQAAMERMHQGGMKEDYWSMPVTREKQDEDEREEVLRGVPIVLPRLVEPTSKTASLEAGDWLAQLRPLIGDVSSNATSWWDELVNTTMAVYRRWLSSGPLQKLHIKSPERAETSHNRVRLDQRVTMLMMQALPESVRSEVIATRQLHAAGVLYRVLRSYQPGGLSERTMTLAALTQVEPAKTSLEAAESLRLWRRQMQRAKELEATLPDATLQVRALDVIMSTVLEGDAQASFRVSSFRLQHEVDTRPTQETVGLLYDVMLAEADQLVHCKPQEASVREDSVAVKALATASPGRSGRGGNVCKMWGTETGCRFGQKCKFVHEELGDKNVRCWTCSSTQHRKAECPHRSQDGGPKGKGQGKAKGGAKGKEAKGSPGEGQGRQTPKESAPEAERRSEVKEGAAVRKVENQEAVSTNEAALLSEAASLLRSLRVQEPAMKVCRVQRLAAATNGMTLLDGGATHCLRQRETEEEWSRAVEVRVQLAQGEAKLRQDPITGTLLTLEPTQAIVPLGKVVNLGYSVRWNRTDCTVEHPSHGKVPVQLAQGCPVVPADWGARMMREVEASEVRTAKIRSLLHCGVEAESKEEKAVAELAAMFPEVPLRVLERIPGESAWEADQLPWNRRQRRRIKAARAIVVNMFSGGDAKRWVSLEKDGIVAVNLDLALGVNVLDPQVGGWLEEEVIKSGKVIAWTAGPPCRTVSVARHRAELDGGPEPLRSRTGEERFGLESLTAGQRELTDHDTALWIKNLHLMRMTKRWNGDVMFFLEQPRDPEAWMPKHTTPARGYPTFLQWPETTETMKILDCTKVEVDQGCLGHQTVKPSTFYTNGPALIGLDGRSHRAGRTQWPEELEARLEKTKSLATWAPMLVELLRHEIREWTKQSPRIKALTAKDKQEVALWQAHFDAGHLPFRRDCEVCLQAAGRDRPRKRIACPDSYCLSVDLAGPFHEGVDAELKKAKYFLVATVTIPVKDGVALVEGLRNLGYKVKPQKRAEKPEEDDGREETLEAGEDPLEQLAVEEPAEEDRVEVAEVEEANRAWKEYLQDRERVEVRTLTQAVPLRSRNTKDVLEALSFVYARLRSLQVPVLRLHSDRARELVCKEVRRWAEAHGMYRTYTAGDEATGNARCERELGQMKSRVRTLIKAASVPIHFWPMALRHAGEERFRAQLMELGIATPALLPFGSSGVAKTKAWFQRSEPWRWPMQKVRILGPAMDMSLTSRGYVVELEDGKWIRSTVVIQPKVREPVQGEVERIQQPSEENEPGEAQEQGDREDHQPEDELAAAGDMDGERPQMELLPTAPAPVKRRVTRKGAPERLFAGQYEADHGPSIAKLQEGGECMQEEQEDCIQEEQEDEITEEDQGALRLSQHVELQKYVKELAAQLQGGDMEAGDMVNMGKVVAQVKLMEDQMVDHDIKVRTMMAKVEEEVLQTKVIPLEQVRASMDDWQDAFRKEYENLTSGPVTRITQKEFEELKATHEVEVVPAKAVATRKPDKRKARFVACGNYSTSVPENDVSTGGIDSAAIRALVHVAAIRNYEVGSIDVRAAFLQAPRRTSSGRVTIVEPPNILLAMGLIQPGEKWRVNTALYGFTESPSDWGDFRDKGLREMAWMDGNSAMKFEATEESNLWRIVRDGECEGYMAVYVDDLLVATKARNLESVFKAIQKQWDCSDPDYVKDGPIRFCGYDITSDGEGGFVMGQAGFLKDMLRKRGVVGVERHPMPKIEDEEDEKDPSGGSLKQAQGMVGELMWLARSRPDVAYAVGVMSRLMHRRPSVVTQWGTHLLKYLNGTQDFKLHYKAFRETGWEHLVRPWGVRSLEVYADTSFAPPHERYRSVQGIFLQHCGNPLMWESSRQAFVTQSTAEGELVGYNEAYQAAEALAALLKCFNMPVEKILYGDNRAALTQCTGETGAWRTRHLRLRSAKLREALKENTASGWTAEHLRGAGAGG